jgi:hypothetical protein
VTELDLSEKAGHEGPEQWIEIEEKFEAKSPTENLLTLFCRRYGAALFDHPWESKVQHTESCASLANGGSCDCEAEVHVLQPTLQRRIRLRWLPPGEPPPLPETN